MTKRKRTMLGPKGIIYNVKKGEIWTVDRKLFCPEKSNCKLSPKNSAKQKDISCPYRCSYRLSVDESVVKQVKGIAMAHMKQGFGTSDGEDISSAIRSYVMTLERSRFLQTIIVFTPLPGRLLAAGFLMHRDLTLTFLRGKLHIGPDSSVG